MLRLDFWPENRVSPGPGQAAGMAWRPKILPNPKKIIFSKIGVIFKSHSCRIKFWMTLENAPKKWLFL